MGYAPLKFREALTDGETEVCFKTYILGFLRSTGHTGTGYRLDFPFLPCMLSATDLREIADQIDELDKKAQCVSSG